MAEAGLLSVHAYSRQHQTVQFLTTVHVKTQEVGESADSELLTKRAVTLNAFVVSLTMLVPSEIPVQKVTVFFQMIIM